MSLGTPELRSSGGAVSRQLMVCHIDTAFAVTHKIYASFPADLQRAFISPSSVTLYLLSAAALRSDGRSPAG
jgi:hypothetical protein